MQMVVMELERLVPKGTRVVVLRQAAYFTSPYGPLYGRSARVIIESKD
jgi:hypothetical protein